MVEAINNKPSVVGGALKAGIVGGVIASASELGYQKAILNKTFIADKFIKTIDTIKAKEVSGKFATSIKDFAGKSLEGIFANMKKLANKDMVKVDIKKLTELGKINWKSIGKTGLAVAAAVATGYMLYRGVKAIFSKEA